MKDYLQKFADCVDDKGNPLVGGNVIFNINGIFYTRVTGNDGDAHLNINLNVGNYTITSTTDNGLSVSNIITINKAKSIINGNDAHIILGTDRVYAVNLIGENNKSIVFNLLAKTEAFKCGLFKGLYLYFPPGSIKIMSSILLYFFA